MTSPSVASAPDAAVVAADKWLTRFRAALVGLLGGAVAGIGALAFYTSFEAIKAYANTSGGIDPKHDFAVPLLVDSFIVVATGADLWFATTGRRRQAWELWWPKALLAGAAAVSFILNVAHVQKADWAARGVAAIPPAALVLGVELLMLVLRRATTIRTARLQAELDKQQLELAALESPPAAAPSDSGAAAVAVPSETAADPGALSVTLERNTPTARNTPALPPTRRNSTSGPKRNRNAGTSQAEPAAAAPTGPQGRNSTGGTGTAEPPSRSARAVAWVRAERAAGRAPTGSDVAAEFHISSGLGRRAIREADTAPAAEPAHQPQAAEALRLVGDRSTPDSEPAPALPAAQGGEA